MKRLHEAVAAKLRPGDLTAEWFSSAWRAADLKNAPYRHWLLNAALPPVTAKDITSLPIAAPVIGDTEGRRDSHNETRWFFSGENRAAFDVCEEVACAFQRKSTVSLLERSTGMSFKDSFLRIEYCQDIGDFWLQPHTDIGAKLLTLSVFLSDTPGCEDWGTDIYDNSQTHVGRAPAGFNQGFAFVPAQDTWHGVERRHFEGVRRSIIINYVKPEWRSRHELSFPDRPIG